MGPRNCPRWRAVNGIKIDTGIRYKSLAELKTFIEAASPVSMFYLDYEFPLYEHFEGMTGNEFMFHGIRSFSVRAQAQSFIRDGAKAGICATKRWPPSNFLNGSRPRSKWRDDGTPITKQWEIKGYSLYRERSLAVSCRAT